MAEVKSKYEIGKIYWASNPRAGHNKQSCGVLIGWTKDGKAVLQNKRWGEFHATIENLDALN